jgi:Tol biopolymer transport system component
MLAFSSRGDIYVINADGSGLRRVTDDGWEPAWSPDGRTIVFQSTNGPAPLDLVSADGTNRRRLFDQQAFSFVEPAWSPDGRQIAFTAWDYGFCDCGLWLIAADGSNPRHVGNGTLWDASAAGSSPAWSPDGAEIAVISRSGVGVVTADGTQRRLLHAGDARDVDWTPDGRLIFARFTSGSNSPSRIFVSDGGSERQLIPDATSPARPGYSDFEVAWRR